MDGNGVGRWLNVVREVWKNEVKRRKLNGGDVEGRYAYNDGNDNDNDGEKLDDNSDDDDGTSDGDDDGNGDNNNEDDGDGDNNNENKNDDDYGHGGNLYEDESLGPEQEHQEERHETRRKEGKGQEPVLFRMRGRLTGGKGWCHWGQRGSYPAGTL